MQQQSQDKYFLIQRQRMQRLRKIMIGMSVCLLLGMLYALWLSLGGSGIPCIFHELTGLDCPSCGVTHMCMALLRLDIAAAWRANAGNLMPAPFFLSHRGKYDRTLCKNRRNKAAALGFRSDLVYNYRTVAVWHRA